jgi:hypothetical protein
LVGETEVFGENLLQSALATTNPTSPDPGSNPGHRGGKPATNQMHLKEIMFGDVEWFQLFRDMVQWYTFVTKVIDILCSIMGEESIHYLSDYQLLKKLLK